MILTRLDFDRPNDLAGGILSRTARLLLAVTPRARVLALPLPQSRQGGNEHTMLPQDMMPVLASRSDDLPEQPALGPLGCCIDLGHTDAHRDRMGTLLSTRPDLDKGLSSCASALHAAANPGMSLEQSDVVLAEDRGASGKHRDRAATHMADLGFTWPECSTASA